MASLWALLPATDAVSAFEWLSRLARGLGADDPRSMDARRADLLTALLTGRLTVAAPDGARVGSGADAGAGEPGQAAGSGRGPVRHPHRCGGAPGRVGRVRLDPRAAGSGDRRGQRVETAGHRPAIGGVARPWSYYLPTAGGIGGFRAGSGCALSASDMSAAGDRFRARPHRGLRRRRWGDCCVESVWGVPAASPFEARRAGVVGASSTPTGGSPGRRRRGIPTRAARTTTASRTSRTRGSSASGRPAGSRIDRPTGRRRRSPTPTTVLMFPGWVSCGCWCAAPVRCRPSMPPSRAPRSRRRAGRGPNGPGRGGCPG